MPQARRSSRWRPGGSGVRRALPRRRADLRDVGGSSSSPGSRRGRPRVTACGVRLFRTYLRGNRGGASTWAWRRLRRGAEAAEHVAALAGVSGHAGVDDGDQVAGRLLGVGGRSTRATESRSRLERSSTRAGRPGGGAGAVVPCLAQPRVGPGPVPGGASELCGPGRRRSLLRRGSHRGAARRRSCRTAGHGRV
jgi:hypothetical protein